MQVDLFGNVVPHEALKIVEIIAIISHNPKQLTFDGMW